MKMHFKQNVKKKEKNKKQIECESRFTWTEIETEILLNGEMFEQRCKDTKPQVIACSINAGVI